MKQPILYRVERDARGDYSVYRSRGGETHYQRHGFETEDAAWAFVRAHRSGPAEGSTLRKVRKTVYDNFAVDWDDPEGHAYSRGGFATRENAEEFARAAGLLAARPAPAPPIMRYFEYEHLSEHLAAVSKPFCDLAHGLLTLPEGEERAVALRKVLEAKDAAVRAALPPKNG